MDPSTCGCVDFESQALSDMEPTIFTASEMGQEGQVTVSSYSSHLVHDFNEDLTKPCNMFCMAWAILLERFTGLDSVCFGFRSEHMLTTESKCTDGVTSAMQVHVTADHSLDDILAGNGFTSAMVPETKAKTLFNTTLSICNLGSQPTCENGAYNIYSWCKLHMSVDPVTMKTLLSWDPTFMTKEQAESISNTYNKIFKEIATQKKTVISTLNCCSEQDELKILTWNGSPLSNVQKCIHQAISEQGALRPDAEAVCAWDGSFSYSQLLTLSDRLAFHLQELGVGGEIFVPICFDKSKWTVVAMLAILKAGGIFVPLDPTQPLMRLQSLTRKVDAETILCSPQHQEILESIASNVISVDAQLFERLVEQAGEVDCGLWSSGAYMIFTSGTTGEPKGALIQHGALLSSALAHGPAMMMDNNTRSLHFAASTFDVSITEILTCLILGGCVCIPSEEARLNAIEEAITQLRVNWALLTPTFVNFISPAKVPSLKTLVTGGEAMTVAVIRSWSHINLINCYGPAETSVVSHVHRGMREGKNPLNIGYQVGINCWVVDRYNHNRLMPVGAVGELVIEGHTLAREYYKEPEKTSEAFIVDPAWTLSQPNRGSLRRMYKTGDLVRYNSDGSFHIAGRKDAQIKFHGQRIELGEIEYHLNVGIGIKHGMVVLPKAGFCEGRLLAIVQLSDALGNDLVPNGQPYKLIDGSLEQVALAKVEETKQLLAKRLPSYMIPSTWLAVEFIPRLQSGKLDRRQTGKWVEDMTEAIYRKLNPVAIDGVSKSLTFSNETESQLHNIWTHVLNLKTEQLGLSQSFLSVGGDSISAMQVMSECKKRGLGLTVSQIISSKSISALARHVKDIEKPQLLQETIETPFELSPIQKLYFSRPNHDQGHYNQSFLLRMSRHIDEPAMRRAIEATVQRHSMLRARFSQDSCGTWQQRVTDAVESSFRLRSVQLTSKEGLYHTLVDSQTCLDHSNGPLLAADLIDEEGQDQRLFVVAHHLVIDLVSWRIILQELEELLLLPELSPDMDTPLPFQAWCKMQQYHASAQAPERALPIHGIPDGDSAYWGMEGTPNIYGQMVYEGFEVGPAQTSLLLSKCHDALRTEIPDVLMAAMVYSFGQTFTDRRIPAIFAEGHGREPWDPSIDLSNVVGWFTTIYPVFAGSNVSSTLIDTIKMVKDGRRKMPDSGRPYFASRWLTQDGERAFSRHWPLEITFNYLGQYQQLEREGALFTPIGDIAGEVRSATDGADVGSSTACISLFEVSAVITRGTLRFSFLFNRNMKHQSKIREWIASCEQNIGILVESLAIMPPEPTLSDFPLVSLTYDRLRLLTKEKLPEVGIEDLNRVEDIYPCSPMQSGLLVSTTKDSAAYAAYTLHHVKSRSGGSVDVTKLANAWKRMVDYHPMLRTVFVESVTLDDSLFDQVVLREVQVPLVMSEFETDDDAISALDMPRHHKDYSQLLHVFEICKSKTGKVFCKLDISHVIVDGTSLSILFRDLSLAYSGILGSDKGPPYSEYIRSFQYQDLQHGIEYWKSYLMDIEPCHFPVLDDGEVVESREMSYFRVQFDELAQLQSLCDDRGVTIVNAIYAAWALVLRLYTASEEVCFGYLTSARDAPIQGIEDVVGPVINMVTCRCNISNSATLGDVMAVVQKDFLSSLEYRHVPLAQVQHALKLSDTALFNTALSYRKLPPVPQNPPDVVFEEVRPTYDPDEYDVSVNIEAGENNMAIDLMYWSDTMSNGQARNVASAFTTALSNILHYSDQPITQLNHLGPQHHQQISQWNHVMPEASESCVHELFKEQMILRPEAPAIASWDADFTYAELDAASTKLAHHIADLGVDSEKCVLVCFDKSAFTVVAMLAVLKAGGVCVPLDPAHPDAAIRLRAEDTSASIAIVSSSMASRLSGIVEKTVVVDSHLLQTISTTADLPQTYPHNACFVIYTSGSTGRPKGVVLEHRGIATNAKYSGPKLGYSKESRVLQFASYTFDNSLSEIFTTLALGGCVCVPSEHERFYDLAGAINRYKVTLADITPTVACLINPLDVPTLKTLALGGEAVTQKCVEIWRDFVSLQCCYGPSECSVNSTYSGEIAQPGKATNIGRAVGSVTWVVDTTDHNSLVPIGCIGELLVDGPIVSRGYLNLPEKMAQSFVAPSSTVENICRDGNMSRKLYKTGDLVRYDSDGTLTYLGRKDTQVKLHGQRIELEEIEHHLEKSLPQYWTSAVELIQFEGKKSLASFICAESGGILYDGTEESSLMAMNDAFRSLAKELEICLSNNIPAYMIPSVWFPVSQMPLTSSGKLDRRRLRSLVQSVPVAHITSYKLALKSGRAPSSNMEKQLAGMWAHVLNVDVNTIGVEDHFFRLGGDSIAAMQLVTLARKSNINLTVTGVFQKVSLQDMAQSALPLSRVAVTAVEPFSLLSNAVPMDTLKEEIGAAARVHVGDVQDMYPCSPIQEGLMALSAKDSGAYVAQFVFQMANGTDIDSFKMAWRLVIEAEGSLRTRLVQTTDGGILNVVLKEDVPQWTTFGNLSEVQAVRSQLPLYNGGKLTDYAIVEDGSEVLFVWTIHHALYDGWCLPLILDKVKQCYENIQLPAPEPIVSGPNYSRFIRYLTEIDFSQDVKFWESYLADIATQHFPRLPNPDHKPNASGLIIHKASFGHEGDGMKSSGLGLTTATMIRSAWALAVSTYAASDDVIFWETMTGRDAPVDGIEEMIGATLTTVPTRIVLDRSQKVSDLLSSVQAQSAVVRMHQFTGIHRIKRINNDTAFACGAQNLLAINYGPRKSTDTFWCDQTNEMAGTNFYSYPLMLSCHVTDGELETVVHFDPEVICESQMYRIMDQFALMLTTVTSRELMDEKLNDLELISTRDYQSLSEMTGQMIPSCEMLVHDVIRATGIRQSQDKVAVCASDQNLTYSDLDSQSTHLSSVLIEAGIRPNTFVPFCMEKSSMVVVSILAILKSGAAFVPLDYAHPDARISGILTDVAATIVLASPQYAERLTGLGQKVISVSNTMMKDSVPPVGHDLSVSPKSPAYCIFTSGTTGRPKGTIISHSAFCTGAMAHGKAMGMAESSRVLQFAAHTFDASIMETLSTLIHGGTVCVPSEEERSNDIVGVIRRMHVNWALLTPSVAQLIEPSTVPELKTLVLGGEAMSRVHVSTWAPPVRLMNAYGPSETSVVATVNSRVGENSSPSNIGRAVGGLCWVIDSTNHDRLVPVGVVGELLVEGPILSQGYLKNPQKNAESFITNPRWCSKFPIETASNERRFYRTGDLVKITEDGSFEFQGRKDNQVKINGQRLELSEIEHHLSADTVIQSCLAFIPKTADEMQMVIDFAPSELTSVRDNLTGHLAAYMIPSTWIVVSHIPLLPSGKLDRRKAIDWVETMSPEQYQMALCAQEETQASGLDREATNIETKLRAAWAKVLGIEIDSVPFARSFIQLGGDSISAMQLVAICRSSNMSLSVSQIMQSKSIVELASFVQAVEDVKQEDEEENKLFPLSPIQKLYFEHMCSESTHFNQSMILETTRKVTPHDLSNALETIVKTHSILRARFVNIDEVYSQRITTDIDGSFVFESHVGVDQCRAHELIEKTQTSLDIFKGPLLAAVDMEMEDTDKQIVFLAAHHLVVDVVSWNILLQDLEGLLSSTVSNLTKPLSFQTWNLLQLQETCNETLDRIFHDVPVPAQDLTYWEMQDVPNLHGDTITETTEFASDVSLQLLGPWNEAFNTDVVDVLLGSLLLSFYESFPDRLSMPTIFNEGHGREPTDNKIDLSRTIGWFTTLCPVYLPESLPAEPDILDAICWIRDFRRRMPGKGRPYFAYQMLSEASHTHYPEWPVELAFNFLGQRQKTELEESVFRSPGGIFESTASQTDIGVDVPRLALIEISASFCRDVLSFSFSYNRQMKHQHCILEWIKNFSDSLQTAVKRMSQAKPEPQDPDISLLPLAFRGASKVDARLAETGISFWNDVEAVYPCSPVQMGILFAQIRNPKFYSYSVTFGIDCVEPSHNVDVHRLEDAWQRVVQRHSTLRTIFVDSLLEEGGIYQVVLRNYCTEVSVFECADDERLQMMGDRLSPQIMSSRPPHHLSIFKSTERKVTCLLEMSHALCDGTSMPILFRDLAMAYEGSLDLTIVSTYRDYVSHLQVQSPHDIEYWREYLSDVEPCHLSPVSRSTLPKVLRYLDQTISHADDLQTFCTGAGVTLSNVLQLTWALVLQAYTGHDDVCFGYLVADRDVPVPNIDKAIGVFINMLVLRVRLDASLTVGDALSTVKRDLSAAMAHRNVSLADIQRLIDLPNEALFNTAYSFQRRSIDKSMKTESVSFDVKDAQDPNEYDLTVNVEVWEQTVELQLCYWADKISDSQARSLASTFDKILTSIITCDLSLPTDQLDVLSDECAQQLMAWNHTEPVLLNQCVHHVFERNVQRLPHDTVAIEAWDASFTYSEVDVVSSRLAHHLVSLGIVPEMYVPLCFEKSAWTPIAMLAVLKAGAAFVPIDPSHPPERTEFLVRNTNAKLILCSTSLVQKFDMNIPVLPINFETRFALSSWPGTPPSVTVQPHNAAYIIFTSGTTGVPKGTIIEHGAFITGGIAHAAAIKMTSDSRVLQFASHTFDASIMEILTTFLVGGCVCIPSEEERMNDLTGVISKYDVNWTLLTPSVAKVLKPGSVPGLKTLVTGGEAMTTDHITKWSRHAALINAYGPSEASVIAASHTKVDQHGEVLNEEPANVGHAVGCRVWVVDSHNHNRLMPIGSIGELLIEGPIVARGYLDNEATTRDAFIDYPPWRVNMKLCGDRMDRMYKTGDLVTYNWDGSLNYFSRKDTQIKLNGQRIELGEIEHHVRANLPTNVQSAVELVSPQGKTSTKILAAFFTIDEHVNEDAETKANDSLLPMSSTYIEIGQSLKTSIKAALPSHMVPAMYVPVTRMPWTSAGKLDRQKLKAIAQSILPQDIGQYKLVGASNSRAPTTATQRKLQKIWANILNIPASTISTDDSFFRLGGDSISAMKVVSAARMEDISLTVMDVLKSSTLSEMATCCSHSKHTDIGDIEPFSLLHDVESPALLLDEIAECCAIHTSQIQDLYPCSALQEGLVAASMQQPGAYVAKYIFKIPPNIGVESLQLAWQRTSDQVDILRSRIVSSRSLKSYQVILEPHAIEWEHYTSLEAVTSQTMSLPERNGGRLARYAIVDPSDSSLRYFVWTVHHALYDAWSMPSLLNLVSQFYQGASTEQPIPVVPYANFARYLIGTDPKASDEFWRAQFQHASTISHFPTVTPSDIESSNSSLQYTMPCRKNDIGAGITIPTIIRGAWALLLGVHTGSDDIAFGETLSGRDIALDNIEDILGPTLTTVPRRVQIDRETTVGHFLNTIQETSIEVIPYQHTGLQHIKRLGGSIAVACDFRNLLVIQSSDEVTDQQNLLQPLDEQVNQKDFFTYPLVVECSIELDNLVLTIHHNETVMTGWRAERLAHQFDALVKQLSHLSQEPNRRLAELQFYNEEDLQMIKSWNEGTRDVVRDSISSLFWQSVATRHDATAIRAWDGHLTYGSLAQHAGHLAKRLVQEGVRTETMVPCCMDKSLWTTVAIVAVILAGGTIVPLDPAHPRARHAEIARECNASIALCSPDYQERFINVANTVITVNEELFHKELCQEHVMSQDLPTVSYKDAAFVIYTSGSTGRAKGVVIEHGTFLASSRAYTECMNLVSTSNVFHFASYAFDIALGETFSTLIMGACLCVPSEEMRVTDLPGAMNTLGATWAFLTPSVANMQDPSLFETLQTLVCGGEAMSSETVSKWSHKVKLINGYGPAECTVFAVANSSISEEQDLSSIGRATNGCHTWIVDAKNHNQLVPVGCEGELLISGPILSRGYLNDKTKTSQLFIEDPTWMHHFVNQKNQQPVRLYKTGDLVRYRPDGTLTFIGRKDNQVKLHGQRMELGEIETCLESDSRLRNALVALPKSGIFKGRLVAVLSFKNPESHNPGLVSSQFSPISESDMEAARVKIPDLQHVLSETLPPYMMPSSWLVVDAIPLLLSGKLDRASTQTWLAGMDIEMPEFLLSQPISQTIVDYDTTLVGRLLRRIWASVLRMPDEATLSSRPFISLGGDSIMAMQVMSRCREHSIQLTMRDIMSGKSIADLVTLIEKEGRMGQNSTLEYEDDNSEPFALSPIQQLFFNNSSNKDRGDRLNQSQLFSVKESIDACTFANAIHSLVQRHPMLRARFNKSADIGQWSQHIAPDTEDSYGFHFHEVSNASQIARCIATSQESIDISGPVFIVDLFRMPDGFHHVSMIAHHLVVDVVSWINIVQDLETFLSSSRSMSPKPLSFRSWNAAQIEHATSMEKESGSLLPFPLRPTNLDFWGVSNISNSYSQATQQSFTLSDAETVSLLLEDAHRKLRTEPLDLFISALFISFEQCFPDRELPTLFNESHGREPWDDSIDLSQTVGWFTSLCPIDVSHYNVDPNDTLDYVRKVKDLRRAIPNNGRPYFAQRYLNNSTKLCPDSHGTMEILLNFLGRSQQTDGEESLLSPFNLSMSEGEMASMSDVGPETRRLALFELSISVLKDGIHFNFMYNKNMLHQDLIRQWVTTCKQVLSNMATELSAAPICPTISDFPLMSLDYTKLDRLVTKSLSTAHMGILLSQLLDPSQYLFHTILEVSASNGPAINSAKLAQACSEVIERHTALRTVFIESVRSGGSFDQVVIRPSKPRINIVKCREIDVMAKLKARSLAKTNKRHGAPILPYQITICETTHGKVFVKLEMNHAVTDGASTAIILRDISSAYADSLQPTKPSSYKDYISYISKQPADSSLMYWKSYLSGARYTEFPSMNSDHMANRSLGSVVVEFDRFSELHSLGSATGVTISNMIMVAWALVLRKYTGSQDVCFGYLASGRDADIDGVDEIVGPLINMLVFRFQFTHGMLLKRLFLDTQEDYANSLPHQHFSVARVSHELGQSKRGFFNTAVSIQNAGSSGHSDLGGLKFESVDAFDPSEYAVTLNANTTRDDEGIVFRYWTNILSHVQAKDLGIVMSEVLNDIIDHGDEALSHLRVSQTSLMPVNTSGVLDGWTFQHSHTSRQVATPTSTMSSYSTGPSATLFSPSTSWGSLPRDKDQLYMKLSTLWEHHLDVVKTDITFERSFFECGGDSIIAMAMVGDARDQDLPLSVADIFKNPTFGSMLNCLRDKSYRDADMVSSDGNTSLLSSKKEAIVMDQHAYEPLSLLFQQNAGQFVRDNVCPVVGVSRASIIDVLPTTDFQSQAIEGSLLESRWMLNYFFLDGTGSLDIGLLQESITNVIAAYDILRTVFVPYQATYLQVILRHVQSELILHDVDDIEQFTLELESDHLRQTPRPEKSSLCFILARHKFSERHRIFIRLSHALYDGVCFPAILNALKASYEGEAIVTTPSYATYLHGLFGKANSDQYTYWRSLLSNSAPTNLIPRQCGSMRTSPTNLLKRTVATPSLAAFNITTATVIKAAWSMVLAKNTGTTDVVFGHLISGRHSRHVPGIEAIVGPCLNVVPVRVQYQDSWTVLDLLQRIQHQQVDNIPYESLGFREIIKSCTNWDDNGANGFSTIVQHQSMPQTGSLDIGQNTYKVGVVASQEDTADFSVVTTPQGSSSTEVCFLYRQDGVERTKLAEQLFNCLCALITDFSTNVETPLDV
ncbi:Non-ribosomal peptide synthetase FpNRPS4 [Fusarium poae]|uniref:Non-ribosomal peptide synthetase FpNRPS4 n=1 Tax=Fusarium poae TaxID=36050 RepID=UPI001CE81B2E|nr:Non-ribosomal peptide synthetase FpNRPS4 [Fusarium poae]KAG8676481.1 Non-ribosomal peptide synthetase FpNRPS4 [Fusarium poae]